LAALPVVSGCVVLAALGIGAAAAAGAVVYVKGNLTQTVNVPRDKVHEAAVQAVKDVGIPVLSDATEDMTTKITSQFSDGAQVWVTLDVVDYKTTKITVRVGLMGEEQRAREVLAKIQGHLGM
jgi:hypothetical protein